MRRIPTVLTLALAVLACSLTVGGAVAAPAVYWASDPVQPGETVLACGSGFGVKPSVMVGRLADKPAGQPPAAKLVFPGEARPAAVYQPGDESAKFVVPADLRQGVFAYRLTGSNGDVSGLLNAPAVWWAQGDRGLTASPGGWIGAFGRNLSLSLAAGTVGYLVGPRTLALALTEAECWSARFALPRDLPAGEYKLYVHNGHGGPAAWSRAVAVTVAAPVAWPRTRFSVLDFGADGGGNRDDTAAVQAALAAAEANGGGVVYFPRGRYRLTEALSIPRKTVLRGESSTLTCLFWPDMEKPPKALLSGSNSFGFEDLTFYAFNYLKFLTADRSGPEAGDVFCRRLVVRANAYRGHMKPEEFDKRWREGLKDGFGGGYWLMDFGGRNVEITDCDLLSSGDVIALRNPRGARIAHNILRAGRWGGSGIFEGDGVIVEHNQYLGQDLTTWGATGGLGYGNLQNVYIGHNVYRMEHGGDREAITADAPGGYFQGKPESADATSLTVPSKPGRIGSGIYILDGKGRGAGLARSMKLAPSMELVALCDENEERLGAAAAATGVTQTYTTYQALLDSDVDAIIVASPMPLHVEHSVQALNVGKHVLSEVNAATNIDECWELLETVRSTGLKYMLAENYCWFRPWSVVMGMVKAGLFGELYYGEAEQIQEFKGGLPPLESGYTWRTAELAMRLGHHYITHDLGPLYQAVGEPMKQVVCVGSGQRHIPWAVADSTCTVMLETVSGKSLRIRLDFFSDRPNSFTYYGLQGTGAAYEGPRAPGEEHRIYVHGRTAPGTWESLWNYSEYLPNSWQSLPAEAVADTWDAGAPLMLEEFARCILDNTKPPVDVVDALNMTAPGLMSEVSRQKKGAPVDVPQFVL